MGTSLGNIQCSSSVNINDLLRALISCWPHIVVRARYQLKLGWSLWADHWLIFDCLFQGGCATTVRTIFIESLLAGPVHDLRWINYHLLRNNLLWRTLDAVIILPNWGLILQHHRSCWEGHLLMRLLGHLNFLLDLNWMFSFRGSCFSRLFPLQTFQDGGWGGIEI